MHFDKYFGTRVHVMVAGHTVKREDLLQLSHISTLTPGTITLRLH